MVQLDEYYINNSTKTARHRVWFKCLEFEEAEFIGYSEEEVESYKKSRKLAENTMIETFLRDDGLLAWCKTTEGKNVKEKKVKLDPCLDIYSCGGCHVNCIPHPGIATIARLNRTCGKYRRGIIPTEFVALPEKKWRRQPKNGHMFSQSYRLSILFY